MGMKILLPLALFAAAPKPLGTAATERETIEIP